MANQQKKAEGLASLGRYGDTMLVHMQPNEVAGLQKLAESQGSTLTINPETGMPEAFLSGFLGSLLPTFAGVAGGAFGGPMGAAAAGALTSYAQGNRDPLAIAMGGLSGYGGGQIGSALGSMPGAVTPTAASAEAANVVASQPAVSNVMGANLAPGVTAAAPQGMTTQGLNAIANKTNNLQHLAKGTTGQGFSPQATLDMLGDSRVPLPKIAEVGKSSFSSQPYPDFTSNTGFTADARIPTPEGRIMGPGGSTISTGPAYGGSIDSINMSVNDATSFQPNFESAPVAANEAYKYTPQTPLEKGLAIGERAAGVPDKLQASGRGISGAFDDPTEFFERVGGKEYYDSTGKLINEGGKGSFGYGAAKVGAPIAMAGMEGYYEDLYDGYSGSPLEDNRFRGPQGQLNLSGSTGLRLVADGGYIKGYKGGGVAHPTGGGVTGRGLAPGTPVAGAMGGGQRQGQGQGQGSLGIMAALGNAQITNNATGQVMDTSGMAPEEIFKRYFNLNRNFTPATPVRVGEVKSGGGIAGLNDGGYLQGPGDGVSDSIAARIEGTQPAALSDGEFVVPARIVSELGNGSSEAGADRLYAMMDRVEKDRERTTGQGNIAVDTNAERRLPA